MQRQAGRPRKTTSRIGRKPKRRNERSGRQVTAEDFEIARTAAVGRNQSRHPSRGQKNEGLLERDSESESDQENARKIPSDLTQAASMAVAAASEVFDLDVDQPERATWGFPDRSTERYKSDDWQHVAVTRLADLPGWFEKHVSLEAVARIEFFGV